MREKEKHIFSLINLNSMTNPSGRNSISDVDFIRTLTHALVQNFKFKRERTVEFQIKN